MKKKPSSRERIVGSALSLFAEQGITAATTKHIAEKAEVNEVTLFRQFGSKQGLLLAVLQEAPIAEKMQAALTEIAGANEPLKAYSSAGLELLGQVPELVRSLIGESGQLPLENQQALGKALQQANQQTVSYLQSAQHTFPGLPVNAGAKLLNAMILGHAVMGFSGDGYGLWEKETDFLQTLAVLMSPQAGALALRPNEAVKDLSADVVRSLFQKAKKIGPQEYALMYVAFGAGLRTEELVGLLRSHSLSSKTQHLLTVVGTYPRQVPLNRWIMGNRYGNYNKNPLTQWLRSRQDEQPEVFISDMGEPLDVAGIGAMWEKIVSDVEGTTAAIDIFQAKQTWCVELLIKGISPDNLSILSGQEIEELEPYTRRAKEKSALEQALSIDQKG
ncbi:MAG: TetR family transcriptional regulator [Leptolyngbya foveolarum]|uniref:TetR family transcriptional regulator n=1 Tax=Leptolyngbya foveolarum TaxID=47253 RepID=A0A2W4TK20_9CYAN|nr:MAG: TetR family transcriptional regulator [Leptolyngbya foveolarum]